MTDPPNEHRPAAFETAVPVEDGRLLELLDRYVDALQSGNAASRSQLLQRHPELRDELQELLSCLDSLNALVPDESSNSGGPPPWQASDANRNSPASQPTVIAGAQTPPTEGDDLQPPIPGGGVADGDAAERRRQELPQGDEFGKYRLLRELGRGGMGVVYLAQQADLDRPVALKMILSSRLASESDLRRFLTEARAAARLKHPNIVGIHEAGEIHGQHFFAMDYVDGSSLAEWRATTNASPQDAAECVAAVAHAVHYLHEQGIVHRDLKPSNILLDKVGNPYVTDFGLARVFTEDSRQTQSGTILGTPSYMPPEQAAGRLSEIAPRSDVYSLGAILYELLSGRPPYEHDNPLDVLVDILEGEPPALSTLTPNVPRELELICHKCLEKDPDRRYASAKELADDLQRYLKREPIHAHPRGVGQQLSRWARREPALVSRLVGLSAASFIVTGRFLYNQWLAVHEHEAGYYLRILGVLGAWAAASFVFQRLLHRERWENAARLGWLATDSILLTTALAFADGPHGTLLIGYPLLVAASGLFFRVRLVLFTTAVALASFSVLMTIRPPEATPPHYPAIFGMTLIVIGGVVAYQVHRVRALSRYYDRRSLP